MWRAEDAWRAELAATTVADLVIDMLDTVPAEQLRTGAAWIQQVEIARGRRPRGDDVPTSTRRQSR